MTAVAVTSLTDARKPSRRMDLLLDAVVCAAQMSKNLPKEKLDKMVEKVTKARDAGVNVETAWPLARDHLDETVVETAEGGMNATADTLATINGTVVPVCEWLKEASGMGSGFIRSVVVFKRIIDTVLNPVQIVMDFVKKTIFDTIDKIMAMLLEVPMVKQALDGMNAIINSVMTKIMELTGLNKLIDMIEEWNPFRSAQAALEEQAKAINELTGFDVGQLTPLMKLETMDVVAPNGQTVTIPVFGSGKAKAAPTTLGAKYGGQVLTAVTKPPAILKRQGTKAGIKLRKAAMIVRLPIRARRSNKVAPE